jgi:diguanylate cyclase (GGDEF)-like protein
MPEFTRSEARVLASCIEGFIASFRREVADVIAAQFRGIQPAEITELVGQLTLLARQLGARQKLVAVHDAHRGLLKRVLIDQRRENAEAIDLPLQKAVDAQLARLLQRDLLAIEHVMGAPWFEETAPQKIPELTDYLSVRHAEAALPEPLVPRPREYDEKFHILEAPSLFLPDLAYYRRRARLRRAPVAVAYLDIDDFKSFNSRYGEPRIDRDLLTPFMEALEAHVFSHGHAYRYGGDEYLLLLPNMARAWAPDFLRALQGRIAAAPYRNIPRAPTVSLGLVVVDTDCALSDREVEERANRAKSHAKATRKGSIAGYSGARFRDEELTLEEVVE